MTLDEARKLGMIIGTADGGCSVCVGDLVERLNSAFPAFRWTAESRYGSSADPEYEGRVVTVETNDG